MELNEVTIELIHNNGVSVKFHPASMSSMNPAGYSFGLPQRIKELMEGEGFIFRRVAIYWSDTLIMTYKDSGYSMDKSVMFFHFMPLAIQNPNRAITMLSDYHKALGLKRENLLWEVDNDYTTAIGFSSGRNTIVVKIDQKTGNLTREVI